MAYKKHEDVKKRAYGQHVQEIENGVFTLLVLSTTGGMGQEAITFYKRLADILGARGVDLIPSLVSTSLNLAPRL